MAPKSIWRGPKAQHFTLVHRSQQDPLLNDAESSNRVLKSTPKRHEGGAGAASGQSRHALERALGAVASKERGNVGEAANYGIMFDDTEYDYMQHLRPIGGNDNSRRGGQDEEEEEEVIMLEAPKAVRKKEKAHDGSTVAFKEDALDLPKEVLPSHEMLPRTFEVDKQTGIRPDMDPHLRQVLEALDDEAFLMRTAATSDVEVTLDEKDVEEEQRAEEDDEIDGFFDEIVGGGELGADEQEPEWRQLPPGGEESIWLDPGARAARELLRLKEEGKGVEELSLESRVALFKKAAAERRAPRSTAAPSSTGSKSIFGEKGASRRSRHAGAKARLAASYYAPSIDGGATAFSMSSSAMERNQGLTDLDEQFARLERIYEQDADDDDDDEDVNDALDALAEAQHGGDHDDIGGPPNVDAIFDDFLSKNEVIGKRMRERLGGKEMTPTEKVDLIRAELGEVRLIDRQTYDEAVDAGRGPSISVEEMISRDLAERRNVRNAWDVETIQSTRTNLENHPRTIAAASSVAPSRVSRIVPGSSGDVSSDKDGASISDRMARVKIDPRTGLPGVAGYIQIGARQARRNAAAAVATEDRSTSSPELDDDSDDDDDDDDAYASDDTTTESNVVQQTTVKRNRNESKEEKKQRKQAVKEEKQARKAQKSMRKQQFKAAGALHAPPLGSSAASRASGTGITLR